MAPLVLLRIERFGVRTARGPWPHADLLKPHGPSRLRKCTGVNLACALESVEASGLLITWLSEGTDQLSIQV